MKKIIETARSKAMQVLTTCSTEHGIYASCYTDGYTSVWARDSMITMIGASSHSDVFEKVFRKSIETLATHQSKKGQIPNDVDIFENRKLVTFATIDSSLWFLLGEAAYKKKFGNALWKKHKKNIQKAITWVEYQDAGEDMLPEQQPTSDWMDCFPHKYGHTINTQALYYAALKALGRKKIIKKFKKNADEKLWSKKLGYYLPWHWKDHNAYEEKEEWFDSLGNMLTICYGLADSKQAKSILNFVEKKGIAKPFPMRAIFPTIKPDSKEWKEYFKSCLAGTPGDYLNGGIWPFIGGFYICALVETKQFSKAEKALELLAKANKLAKAKNQNWDFNEWIHP
ncbi:MAG TPA: glycoside hydrolase 100 family protein, partial [archaeon]|nr:glycoside hydrolase 100 family protein [archaeon]